MRSSLSSYLRLIFLIGDLLLLNAAALLSFVRAGYSISSFAFILFIGTINTTWLLLVFLVSPYKFSRVSKFVKIFRVHLSFILIFFLTVATILFVLNISLSVSVIGAFLLLSLIGLILWRVVFIEITRSLINKSLNSKNVVIVGYGDLALEMRKFFRLHPQHGYRFLGYFSQNGDPNKEIHALSSLKTFCQTNNVEEIYCCLPYLNNNTVKQLTDFGLMSLIKVKLIIDFKGVLGRGLNLERYDQIPVLKVSAIPLDERYNQVVKRIFDIVFSGAVILTILSWLVPLIALLIKMNSKGPVFFRQKRAGQGNRPFDCLKFRTMYLHGHDFVQATKNDPRVTPIGRILRKTSLDELPQFFNVLFGDMSIIGPRPHPFKLNEQFSGQIENFMARHYVKPGITGLAQAKGFRGETRNLLDMRNRVKLDRFYIENWSFILDLKIIIATIISIAKGDQQAY